jgi:hypothetical protein
MKIRKILLILFSIFPFILFAQQKEKSLSFHQKKQLNKTLRIEAITQDGNLHRAFLYYADDDQLVLVKEPFVGDSLELIQSSDIFQLKAVERIPYFRRFLNGMSFSAVAMTLLTAEMYSHGDEIMIGPEFVILSGTVFLGTPFSLLTALLLPKERTVFDFRVEGKRHNYEIVKDYMTKKSLATDLDDKLSLKEVKHAKNEDLTAKLIPPHASLHPLAIRKFHIEFGSTLAVNDYSRQIKNGLLNPDLKHLAGGGSDRLAYHVKLQTTIHQNYRPYLSFIRGQTGYGSSLIKASSADRIYIDYSTMYGHLGVDYVLRPVNNLLTSPFEFSFGAGLAYSNFEYSYSTLSNLLSSSLKTSSAFGLGFSAQADYYISPALSLNLMLAADLFRNMELSSYSYTTEEGSVKILLPDKLSPSIVQLGFGIYLHL